MKVDKGGLAVYIALITYQLIGFVTLIYLVFFNTNYNWWNWIILLPLNFIIAEFWPIYWLFVWLGWAS